MFLSYYFFSPNSSQIFLASLLTQLDIFTLPSLSFLSQNKKKNTYTKQKSKQTNLKKKARPKFFFFAKRKQNEKKKLTNKT